MHDMKCPVCGDSRIERPMTKHLRTCFNCGHTWALRGSRFDGYNLCMKCKDGEPHKSYKGEIYPANKDDRPFW